MTFKELRRKNKMSQSFVANELGISRDTLRAIENGKSSFKIEHLLKLSNLYNMSTEKLLNFYAKMQIKSAKEVFDE